MITEMAETQIIPERWKVLSGSALKCIALITMIVDHSAYVLLTKGTHLYTVMRAVGRLAFPIYCFLITEGFLHTRDRKKYGVRLFLFALISELPWNLMNHGTLLYGKQNVFFTLLLGYLGLCAVEFFKDRPRYQLCALTVLFLAAVFLKADYGAAGYGFILLLYVLRDKKILQAGLGSCFLSGSWKAALAFIPINLYNGKRGFVKTAWLKYAFYVIYPLHLLILAIIRIRVQH